MIATFLATFFAILAAAAVMLGAWWIYERVQARAMRKSIESARAYFERLKQERANRHETKN